MSYETVANRIVAFRKAAGLTQEQLGKLCGQKAAVIGHWESKIKPQRPNLNNLLVLCGALGRSPNELLGWNAGAVVDETVEPVGKQRFVERDT